MEDEDAALDLAHIQEDLGMQELPLQPANELLDVAQAQAGQDIFALRILCAAGLDFREACR